MKNLYRALAITLFCFITNETFSQIPCNPADNVKATVSNVVCNAATNNLTFDLTITVGGAPHTPSTANSIVLTPGFTFLGSFSSGPVTDRQTTTTPGTGCPDVSNIYVNVDDGFGLTLCSPFLELASTPTPAAIPTIGEWGLIILGLFLTIFGALAVVDNTKFEGA